MSGPGAPCVGPALLASGPGSASGPGAPLARLFLCQVPAVCVWGPGAFCRGLCWSPAVLSQRSPCVGARRSLCRDPILSVESRLSGLALSVCWSRPNDCVSGPGALCVGPGALSVGARRSLCQGPARGPAPLCRAPRSLCRGPGSGALCQGVCGARIVSLWGPGALCRRCRRLGRCFCEASAVSMSGPDALCVGARRSVSGPGAPSLLVSGPGALCRESASGPGGPLPRLPLSRPGALCVGPLSVGVCVGARRSYPGALCVGA